MINLIINRFELLPEFEPRFRYVIPVRLTGPDLNITLFAIWAMDNKENRSARYIGQVWFALDHYAKLIGTSTILVGDFNSNKIWDFKDRIGSHSDVVNHLFQKDIHSVYHHYYQMEQGMEEHPTFYLYKNKLKPYHLDYCFVSGDLLKKVTDVEVGTHEPWKAYSDHSPISIKFEI